MQLPNFTDFRTRSNFFKYIGALELDRRGFRKVICRFTIKKAYNVRKSTFFVDKDFDDPFEHAVKKRVAFAGVDLCFAFRFSWGLPVFPFKDFEENEIEVQAFLEFRGVRILDECDGALPRFRDIRCRKDFTRKTT